MRWNAQNERPRGDGRYFDAMWRAALAASPHAVSITSYNEWGEGTQIEEARPHEGRRDYGAVGEGYYMRRTAHWANVSRQPCPRGDDGDARGSDEPKPEL